MVTHTLTDIFSIRFVKLKQINLCIYGDRGRIDPILFIFTLCVSFKYLTYHHQYVGSKVNWMLENPAMSLMELVQVFT